MCMCMVMCAEHHLYELFDGVHKEHSEGGGVGRRVIVYVLLDLLEVPSIAPG